MRMSWRLSAVMLLVAVWPQVGCLQMPTTASAPPSQPARPQQANLGAAPKPPVMSPAEMAQAMVNQADALEKAGRLTDAIGTYEKVRQFGGDYALYATKRLALLHDYANNADRAEQEYQLLLSYNKQHQIKDAELLYHAGDFYSRRGLWPTAEKHLTDAVYYQPNHPQATFKLGLALAHNEAYSESLNELAKVVSKSEAYCNVAFVMTLQGKCEDAARAYQAALGEEPNMPRARAELAKLNVAPTPISGAVFARHTTTPKTDRQGSAEVEEHLPTFVQVAGEGTNRLMSQRPTLPALVDLDLTSGAGRDADSSEKKSKK